MKLKHLKIFNLRNHSHSEIDFSDGINLIYGPNGSGKTTILEAISICSMSKSFLPTLDQNLIKYEQKGYEVGLRAINDLGAEYKVDVKFSSSKKKISNNDSENLSPKNLIGNIPIVVLSPDYKSITFGSPGDRRDFIDKVISQISKSYLSKLIQLKKVLKQRNSLLSIFKKNERYDDALMEPWTEKLIDLNADIVMKRHEFINELMPMFKETFKEIAPNEEVELIYYAYKIEEGIREDKVKIMEELHKYYEYRKEVEYHRASTIFGPQKDDLIIKINSGIAKDYASQGQHKSLLISLKIAEFNYLKSYCNETPIVLLDDIFAELDESRSKHVIDIIEKNGVQSFITSTNSELLNKLNVEKKLFNIEDIRDNSNVDRNNLYS
jgi:DNA replication and repair protein RecF